MRAGLVHDRSTHAHRLASADEPQHTECREAARDQHVLGLGLGVGVGLGLGLGLGLGEAAVGGPNPQP